MWFACFTLIVTCWEYNESLKKRTFHLLNPQSADEWVMNAQWPIHSGWAVLTVHLRHLDYLKRTSSQTKGVLWLLCYCLLLKISTCELVFVSDNRALASNERTKQLQSMLQELPSSLIGSRWHTADKNKIGKHYTSNNDVHDENSECVSFSFTLRSLFVCLTPKQQVE